MIRIMPKNANNTDCTNNHNKTVLSNICNLFLQNQPSHPKPLISSASPWLLLLLPTGAPPPHLITTTSLACWSNKRSASNRFVQCLLGDKTFWKVWGFFGRFLECAVGVWLLVLSFGSFIRFLRPAQKEGLHSSPYGLRNLPRLFDTHQNQKRDQSPNSETWFNRHPSTNFVVLESCSSVSEEFRSPVPRWATVLPLHLCQPPWGSVRLGA